MVGEMRWETMNDFERCDKFQREKRDEYLAGFYGEHSAAGRYVFLEKSRCSLLAQKRLAVDTVLQKKNGGSVCIEEKIVREKFPNFFLETKSCTVPGYESAGWMVYGQADYLFYCFYRPDSEIRFLECYLIDFADLQNWFWPTREKYKVHTMPDTINKTEGRLVPISDVREHVGFRRFYIGKGGKRLDRHNAN